MKLKSLYNILSLPITVFGAVLIVANFLLYYMYIKPLNDIVLSVFVVASLGLFFILLVFSTIQRWLTKKTLQISVAGVNDSYPPTLVQFSLNCSIPFPLYRVEVFFIDRDKITTFLPTVVLNSSFKKQVSFSEELLINFPHRGNWEFAEVLVKQRCPLGLTSCVWRQSFPKASIKVGFKEQEQNFNLSYSSQEVGEVDYNKINARGGDYYDLKPYTPNDSLNKIAWKLFAKSGQLISRMPEETTNPEKRVFIFALVDRYDDLLCGKILNLLKELERSDIGFFFSTLGSERFTYAQSSLAAYELMIKSAQFDYEPDLSSARVFLENLNSLNLTVGKDFSNQTMLLIVGEGTIARRHNSDELNKTLALFKSANFNTKTLLVRNENQQSLTKNSIFYRWFFNEVNLNPDNLIKNPKGSIPLTINGNKLQESQEWELYV
jgi:Protein of unknown function DUF58